MRRRNILGKRMILLLSAVIGLTACSLTQSVTITPQATDATPFALTPLVYYYFPSMSSNTFPAGSVVIVPDTIILSPTLSEALPGEDVAQNIQTVLQVMSNDPRNLWQSPDLTLSEVSFASGQATVRFTGEILGTGDVVLQAARMQILMTVFTSSSVQSALVMLNGESIANLGISHSSEAKPPDFVYTRADIEAFMRENALN